MFAAGINPHPQIDRQETRWERRERTKKKKQPFTTQSLSFRAIEHCTVLALCCILTGDEQGDSIATGQQRMIEDNAF